MSVCACVRAGVHACARECVRTFMQLSAASPFVSMPVCATVSFVLVRLLVFIFFSLSL